MSDGSDSARASATAGNEPAAEASVAALLVYPVKSCRGVPVQQAQLDARGFVGDRRFLVVDDQGRFLTQRDTPRLALIAAEVNSSGLRLDAAGTTPLEVRPDLRGVRREIVIWRDKVRALDLGDVAADWLSQFLQRPARLMTIAPETSRPMTAAVAHPGDQVAFSDAHPLLILSEGSLADLNARLDEPLGFDRFRPNIVVSGVEPFAEDRWRRIRIGAVVLRASGPCARCVITTADQRSLARGKEPLRTLALYRRGSEGEVLFGQNYIHETKRGTIEPGMPVTILE